MFLEYFSKTFFWAVWAMPGLVRPWLEFIPQNTSWILLCSEGPFFKEVFWGIFEGEGQKFDRISGTFGWQSQPLSPNLFGYLRGFIQISLPTLLVYSPKHFLPYACKGQAQGEGLTRAQRAGLKKFQKDFSLEFFSN